MARAALKNISSPKKKVKKRVVSLEMLKLGDEPSFIYEPSAAEFISALNWYTQCSQDPEEHKAWVSEYLSARGWSDENVRSLTSKIKKMIKTYVFLARMFNRHQPIDIKYDAEAISYFEKELLKQEEDVDDDGNIIIKPNQPMRQTGKLIPFVNFIEDQIQLIMENGAEPKSIYTKLVEMGCNASVATQLKKVFAFTTEEFTELSKPSICDEELEEAYKTLSVPTRKKLGLFVKNLNEDLSAFAKVAKATRKPRKKKVMKADKIVARLKFKTKDDTFKIASVDPTKIIGASWLWVFNTKYRTLQYYEAGDGGLSVKGTTITNIKASGQKKLRKPEDQLASFTSGAVKALPKHFDLLKTSESEPNGRINSDTVLLRTFV